MVELKEVIIVAAVGWSAILVSTVPIVSKSLIEAKKWRNNESLGILHATFMVFFWQVVAFFGYWLVLLILDESKTFTIWADAANTTDFYKFWQWNYDSLIDEATSSDKKGIVLLLQAILWSKKMFYMVNALIVPILYYLAIMIGYKKAKSEVPYGESDIPSIVVSTLVAFVLCTLCILLYNSLASILLFLPDDMDLEALSHCWWQTAFGMKTSCTNI